MPEDTIKRGESWFRPLRDGRLEICLYGNEKVEGLPVKVRASGPEDAIWKTVEFFEEVTGMAVEGDWRRPPRTGSRPIAGQLTITEQLESDGNGEDQMSTVRSAG